jgi:hypothetical protein
LGSVFVKRAEVVDASFAEVDIYAGDSVARLADRASAKFRWLVGADKVKFFLVPDSLVRFVQRDPALEADVLVDTNLCLATDLLAEAGIRERSCLLARLSSPPAAAPGECARAARSLLSCSPSRGAGGARGTCKASLGIVGALTALAFLPSTLCRRRRRRPRERGGTCARASDNSYPRHVRHLRSRAHFWRARRGRRFRR